VGRRTVAGMYRLADETYAKLVDELAKDNFSRMPLELRKDVLNFYQSESNPTLAKADEKRLAKLHHQLEMLRAAAAYSRP